MAAEQVKLNVGSCPSLETIGAFLDGRFKDREREIVADHLASCESCYFVFTESARASAARPPAHVAAPRRALWTRTIVPGLALAATLLLAVNLYTRFSADADTAALSELATAVGTQRVFEPRLTGGFAYGPVIGVRRGGPGDRPSLSPDARIIIARIEKSTAGEPASRVRGVAMLVAGDTDGSVEVLEHASADRTGDARVLSDLAAAYLSRAEQRSNTDDNSQALTAANRALSINRLLPEALFNRAIALERLRLTSDAVDAWRAYLTIDDRSGWADEARARLRILSPKP